MTKELKEKERANDLQYPKEKTIRAI